MHVLLVDPSDRGGILVYTDLVARALAESGAEVTLLGSSALAGVERPYPVRALLPVLPWGRPAGAGARFYAQRLRGWVRGARTVVNVVEETRPDVVHWQFGLNRRLDARVLARVGKRVPQVWTAHDVLPMERTPRDLARFAEIYRAADRVIVHNAPAADAVRKLAGVDATQVEHPAPDLPSVDRAAARDRLGWPDERTFLAAGHVRRYKGYDLLADVWERLGPRAPRLVVVGLPWSQAEGDLLDRLEKMPAVTVRREFVADDELHLLVRAADALLLPYRESSDSGLVHLARAAGTPVIASDVEQLAATVRTTGAGRVLPRDVPAWEEAVTGALPAPPEPPPPSSSVARAHLDVYDSVVAARSPAGAPETASTRLLVYTDADLFAGAERSLATLLSALDPSFEVVIAGVHDEVVDELRSSRPGSRTLVLPHVRNKSDYRAIAAHVRAFRRVRADLFHANLRIPWSCQYGILAASLVPGLPIVAVEHAPVPPSGGVQRRLRRLLVARYAAHVAVSDGAARQVEDHLALAGGTIRTIYNGVPDRDLPRPADRERVTVGTAARLVSEKRVDLLLRAAARLPEVDVLIVGEGPERSSLEALAESLGMRARVTFQGWGDDPRRWPAEVDVCAVTSDVEAFSLTAVQAMLAEVPVVATAVGGVPEVVADGVTGRLVPPGDVDALARVLAELVADPAERHRLGRAGRERALARFTPEKMARSFENLYSALLADRVGP